LQESEKLSKNPDSVLRTSAKTITLIISITCIPR